MKFKLPVLPLPNVVFFPHTNLPVHIIEPFYVQLVEHCLKNECPMGISLAIPSFRGKIDKNGIFKSTYIPMEVCAYGEPYIMERLPDDSIKILIKGTGRAKIKNIVQNIPFPIFEAVDYPDQKTDAKFTNELGMKRLQSMFRRWIEVGILDSVEREMFAQSIDSIHQVVDYLSMLVIKDIEVKQILLETTSIEERVHSLNMLLVGSLPHKENDHRAKILKQFENLENIVVNGQ